MLKLHGTVMKKDIVRLLRLISNNTSRRTGVEAITSRPGTVHIKRSIQLFDAHGIANDLSSASVENRLGLSNHWHREQSRLRYSDLIEGCLPVTLSSQRTRQIHT